MSAASSASVIYVAPSSPATRALTKTVCPQFRHVIGNIGGEPPTPVTVPSTTGLPIHHVLFVQYGHVGLPSFCHFSRIQSEAARQASGVAWSSAGVRRLIHPGWPEGRVFFSLVSSIRAAYAHHWRFVLRVRVSLPSIESNASGAWIISESGRGRAKPPNAAISVPNGYPADRASGTRIAVLAYLQAP